MTSKKAFEKFGTPGIKEGTFMRIWDVPTEIREAFEHVKFSAVGTYGFPARIYINKSFVANLEEALRNVIERGLTTDLKTWDGCYIIRSKRLSTSYSLHSWGLAIDINAFENRQGTKGKLSPEFVKCFTDAGMNWGGAWQGKYCDPMHFEKRDLD